MVRDEIRISNLSKNYGNKQALKGVSLYLEKGMFGLLGRNGAGKTTLMRILTTLLNKSTGEISICGIPVEKASEIRKIVGYLPQDFSCYPNMNVYEALDYLGVLSGVEKRKRKERIVQLLEEVNLGDCRKVKVKALSGGMKRRLGIAQALLHEPKVLIVDEPTAGLDPEERIRFRNLLCEVAKNKIVMLSTHIVEDIEKTCENIAILDKGEIIYNGLIKSFIGEAKGLEEAYMLKMGGHENGGF
jgi:ABC-type multidrug transport system, ATPase component